MTRVLGFALIFMALNTVARAGHLDVPEIDPASVTTGLTLLSGCALLITARRRRSA